MTKKKVKRQVFPDIMSNKAFRQVARKTKATTKKTTTQAKHALRSMTDQVAGTKQHEKPEFSAPRITTEMVAEEREEVLSKARRFIYPLQSKRRVVLVSLSIILGVLAVILLLTGLMLYGFKSTDGFTYNISRFIPFPVARVDGEFIAYEKYLFEVRNSLFYLSNYAQEGVDIDSEEGQALVKDTKTRILEKIQRDELARQLAQEAGIVVTAEEVDAQVKKFEIRGGIEQSQGTLESILAKYYDWSLDDLKRVVELQLIYYKLMPVLDEEANDKIDNINKLLTDGSSFESVAKSRSEDENTASDGGKVGTISRTDSTFDDVSINAIFALNEGAVSQPIATPTGYYIFKVNKIIDDENRDISQIVVRFFDIDEFLGNKLERTAHRAYITVD